MAKTGRPPSTFPRRNGLFVRLSDTEHGALVHALASEHPVAARRPALVEWARDLLVAHASEVLRVEVTRAGVRHQKGGAADWKRWKVASAVKRAAPRRRKATRPKGRKRP